MSAGNSRSIKTLALLCRGLFHRYGYGSRTLAAHRLYYVFRVVAARALGGDRLERESVVEPFCRSDSAGILFTMLAALRLKRSWMYWKIQVLAIFDDLDTIPADDTSANPDDRPQMADVVRHRGHGERPARRRVAVASGLEREAGLEAHPGPLRRGLRPDASCSIWRRPTGTAPKTASTSRCCSRPS